MRYCPALWRFIIVALFLLPACAGQRLGPSDDLAAKARWDSFQNGLRSQATGTPFFLSGTISYQDKDKGHRLLFAMFGDAHKAVRLDLTASVGQQVAAWLEDDSGWFGYFPSEKRAFTAADSRQAAAKLGVPLPFGLRELAEICRGRFAQLLPQQYTRALATKDGYLYELPPSSNFSSLTLDTEGNLLHLTARGRASWRVVFSDYPEAGTQGPRIAKAIEITGEENRVVNLRLRRIESRPQGIEAQVMDLPIPAGVPVQSLDAVDAGGPTLDVRSRKP